MSVVAGETGLRTPPLSDLSLSETMIVNTEGGRRHTHERERVLFSFSCVRIYYLVVDRDISL